MKNYIIAIVIVLFFGQVSGQDNQIGQIEEMDVVNIQERAKVDAKADFTRVHKLAWVGSFFISLVGSVVISEGPLEIFMAGDFPLAETSLIAPPVLAGILPVNLPENREKELSRRSSAYPRQIYQEQYRGLYRESYVRQIKIQRVKYLLGGGVLLVIASFPYFIWAAI